MIKLKPKSKTKKRPFDYRKKKLLSKARNQAPLVVPDIGKVRTAPAPKFRKRNQGDLDHLVKEYENWNKYRQGRPEVK